MAQQFRDRPPDIVTVEESQRFTEFGQHLASSDTDQVQQDDLAAIDEHAHAFTREASTEPFDPATHAHDRVRDEAYQRDVNDLKRESPAVDFAQTREAEAEVEVGRHQQGLHLPKTEAWGMATAILFLSMTIAPTAHDQFFVTIEDWLLAWAASVAVGVIASAFVVITLLQVDETAAARSVTNWIGLVAGVIVGVGMFGLRVAYATDGGDYKMAVALTCIEIAIIALLESRAVKLREAAASWGAQQRALALAQADLDAAREDLRRRQRQRDDREARIASHASYVEWRSLRHSKSADLQDVAKSVMKSAYEAKVAENFRRRTGASITRMAS
jgi:hypothetical protein